MNFKVALIAGAIAFSGQTAFAATDHSCNPFARGESCSASTKASSVASSQSAFFRFGGFARGDAAVSGAPAAVQSKADFLSRVFGRQTFALQVNKVDVVSFEDDNGGPVVEGEQTTDVSAVPVPAAGFLLLAGLGGLVALRRKKS